jgi:PAS domain S-box-containing protein
MDNHHLRVLLIEDNKDDYLLTRNLLRKVKSPRFDLEWVSSYNSGVEAVERNQHDVVLLDDNLGQRSGLELLRQMIGSGCQTPIIVLTNTSDRETDLEAMEAGAADYLEKQHLDARLLERSIRYVVERKRVEAALAAERNLLRTLIDNLPDFIYAKDSESRYILNNVAHARSMGVTNHEEIIGKNDFDYFPHEFATQFYADEQAVIRTGQPLVQREEPSLGQSGEQIWASTTKVPLRDDTGKVIGTLGVTRDITAQKRAETALVAERNLLRTLIDNVPDAVYAKDTESRFIVTNKTHLRYLGLSSMDEVIGKTDFDLFPKEMAARFYADEQAVIQSGQPLINHEELTQDLPSGNSMWAATTKVPLRDDTGKILGIVGVTHDLTRRKRMEEALATERGLLRTLIDTVPDAIFTKDKDSRFVLSNKSHLRILGAATMDEVVGKTDFDLFPTEMAAKFYADEQAVIQTGQPYPDQEERTIDLTTGNELWVATTKVPLRDDAGNVLGIVGITRDLTERKKADDAIRASEERYRILVRNLPDTTVILFDRDLRYTLVEGAALSKLGYDRDVMEGKTVWEVLRPEHIAQYEAVLRAALAGQATTFETEIDSFSFHASVVPVKDKQGDIVAGLFVAQDITERKRAEVAQRDSEERYRTLVRNLPGIIVNMFDHDLRYTLSEGAPLKRHGYDRTKLEGKTVWEALLPERAAFYEPLYRAALAGQKAAVEVETDGFIYHVVIAPVKDETGAIVAGLTISEDISERKQIEVGLATERNVLRTLIDALPDYIFVKDRMGRFVVSNTAHALAVKVSNPDDLVGKTAADFFPAEMAAQFDADDQAIMQSGEPLFNLERQTIDATGGPIWVATTKVPLRDEHGEVTGLVGISRDITERKAAEEAVRDSLIRYHLVARATNDVIWDWNLVTDTIEWNNAIETLFGYDPDQVSHYVSWWMDHIHPDDQERLGARFAAVISGEQTLWSEEHRFLKADDTYAVVMDRGLLATDENGTPVRMIGSMIDITANKKAEAALRESETRFRFLFERSPDAIFLLDPHNPEVSWPIVDCNASACAMNGYSREELIGQTIDILHEQPAIPAERTAYLERLRREGGMNIEAQHRRKDGTIVNIQVRSSVLNLDGRELVLGIDRDITERKQAEAALRESEERFRATFEQAAVGIGHMSLDGRWLRVNQKYCDILGFTREELFKLTWQEITHPDDLARNLELQQGLVAGDVPVYQMEKRYRHKPDLWTNVTVSVVRKPGGEPDYLIAVLEDISERKKIEAALRESEERYRGTFEQAAVGVAHAGTDGKWLRVNQKLCDILGYTREALLERTWLEVTHPDDLTTDFDLMIQALMGELDTYSNEKRFTRLDGSTVWVNLTVSAVRELDGEYKYGIFVIEDISERKQAEEAVRESEERFRATFEQAAVGIALTGLDGKWLRVNQKLCDILGYSREELFERTWQEVTHPDDFDSDADQAAQLLAGKLSTYTLAKRYVGKHGLPIWVNMTVSLVRDSAGAPQYFIAVIEDIRERKHTEEALQESEERYRLTFEQAGVGVAYNDDTGRFIWVNQKYCDILGYSREELIERTWQELTHPDDRDKDWAQAQQLIAGEISTYSMEKRYLRKGGASVWVSMTTSLLRDSAGAIKHGIVVIEDISERKQAEEALQESEERFRSTFEQVTVGMSLVVEGGRWMRVNQKLCEILGYSNDEMLQRTWMEMTYPDDLNKDSEQANHLMAGEIDGYTIEKRFIRKDGTPVWTSMTTSLVRHPSGELNYGVAVIEDISARKQIEATLATERNLLRTLIDNLPDYIFVKDKEGRFITTNEAGWHGFGVPTLDDLIGKTDSDFLPHEVAAAHRELEEQVILSGQAILDKEEMTFEIASGRYLWILASKMPLRDNDGNIYGLVGISRDITERKQAEEALRESEEKFRQLAESINQVFWMRDPDAKHVLYVSPAYEKVWGRSSASLLEHPQSFLEAVHPQDQERVLARYKFKLKGGFDDEFRIIRPDGSLHWVWVRNFPVLNAAGEVYRVVVVAEDITLRKQAEAQEIELAAERTRIKVVERFISDASHDLRTPLSIMQTSLYLLEKNTDPEKRKRHADNLGEQITHITRVLEDFLNLGKLDQLSHADLHLEECDLSTLVHAIRAEQQPFIAQKQHQVKLNLTPNLSPIMAEKAELERALRHIIVNAINFTPDGGTITIETRQDKEYTVFEVRDSGIGIGPEDLPFIFERFYRADKARDIATGGSGLGLTIANKIIEAHGGKIEVESTPGEGSVFRVRL